eukprot:gene5721-11554_t
MLSLIIVFHCHINVILSYSMTPSLQPLHYIDIPALGEFLLKETENSLLGLIIPQSLTDAASSIVSSGLSGFIAGLAVTVISVADGNTNLNETTVIFAGTSGFYFATKNSVSVIGEIIGMSTPVVDVLTIVLPILVSELFKLRAQAISEQQTRVGQGPTMYQLMKFANPPMKSIMKFREQEDDRQKMRQPMLAKITPTELVSDITKWLSYSGISSIIAEEPIRTSAEAGAIAGVISQIIKDRDDIALIDDPERVPKSMLRLLRSVLEGSMQFVVYECSRKGPVGTRSNDVEVYTILYQISSGFAGLGISRDFFAI